MIIKNQMALRFAKKKFGTRAFVAQIGKKFIVGTMHHVMGKYFLTTVYGESKSWGLSLLAAGITLPIEATIAGEILGSLHLGTNTNYGTHVTRDSMLTDTDAKEPDLGEE